MLALLAPDVKAWLAGRPSNAHYMASTNVTHSLEYAGLAVHSIVHSNLLKSITRYGAFSYMGDESTAISNHQFATLCVRYLDDSGKPVEAFVGLTELTQTTADAIKGCIDRLFERAKVDINKMTSCSFDGGANYSGCKGGV